MQKRAFVEHFVGGRLTALSWLSRGGVDASTRRHLQADGLVARQAAQGRRVRVQQGSLDAVEALQVHEVPQQGVRHHVLRALRGGDLTMPRHSHTMLY